MKNPFIPLISACIVLLLSIGAYVFWYEKVASVSAQAASLTAQLATQRTASSQEEQVKTAIDELNSNESTIQKYFISTSDVVPFLEQLQSLGSSLGAKVQIASVSATPANTTTPYGHLNLTLSISGTFAAVMRTLGSIEYQPYDTAFSALSISSTPTLGGTAAASQWTAILSVTVASLPTKSHQSASVVVPVATTTLPTITANTFAPVSTSTATTTP